MHLISNPFDAPLLWRRWQASLRSHPIFGGSKVHRLILKSTGTYSLRPFVEFDRMTSQKGKIFRRFPDEIQRRSAREFLPAKSASPPNFNRMPSILYVVLTFGLFAGLVRQKDIPADSLISSQAFKYVCV